MRELKRVCDICGKTVDHDDPAENSDSLFNNYSIIDIKVESRNPMKRCRYESRGTLIACEECMDSTVHKMAFSKIMNRMVSRVQN